MTPDLMEDGERRARAHRERKLTGRTYSGGRQAGFGRLATPGEVDVTHGRILYLEDVSVSFDGFKAINALSLDIAPGELRCIIGPNGAGKTTLMDIITGKTRPDAGTVFFGSTIDLLRYSEPQIAQLGIGRKFQKPTVFERLTVFENLELALKTDKGVKPSMFFRLDSGQGDRLAQMLHTVHLAEAVRRPAGTLSHGQKQWLEIGMLLMQDPKLLLLDEPVAGMTGRGNRAHRRAVPAAQGQAFADGGGTRHEFHPEHFRDRHGAVRRLGAGPGHAGAGAERRACDRGLSWEMRPLQMRVVLPREASRVSPRGGKKKKSLNAEGAKVTQRAQRNTCSLLRSLRILCGLCVQKFGAHQDFVRAEHAERQEHQPVLRRLAHPARRQPAGASRQGHGAAGAQRRGQDHAAQGADGPGGYQDRQHRVRRQVHSNATPYQRARAGIGFVPQGREIFGRLTVEENLRMGLAYKPAGEAVPAELFELFPVLKQMLRRRGGDLSGGQQQQLAIARALAARPKLLILDEPTEGIQPSIIKDIGRVIRMLADRGDMAILLVEQYYDFARDLADDYLVMQRGEFIARGRGCDMQAGGVRELVAI